VSSLRGQVIEMAVPEGQVMVQVEADPTPNPNGRPWDWVGGVGAMGVKDDKGQVHKVVGAWASYDQNNAVGLVAGFQADPAQSVVMPQFSPPAPRPTKIWLAAYVPRGSKVKEVVIGAQVLKGGLDVTAE
jgi:hypothetical protein